MTEPVHPAGLRGRPSLAGSTGSASGCWAAPYEGDRLRLYIGLLPNVLYSRYLGDGERCIATRTALRQDPVAYDLDESGASNARVFYDVTDQTAPGAPDGMKVDTAGNIFATGPGGVWVFTPDGEHLGTIMPDERPANVGRRPHPVHDGADVRPDHRGRAAPLTPVDDGPGGARTARLTRPRSQVHTTALRGGS